MSSLSTPRQRSVPMLVIYALVMVMLAGCGKFRGLPVEGAVTLDGKPFPAGGTIQFIPDASKGNMGRVSCKGLITNAHYKLSTMGVTQSETGPGVSSGWYKVVWIPEPSIRPNRPNASGQTPKPQLPVNDIYQNVETTPLTVEVKAHPSPEAYDIKLTE
jgi:hypothetical protein